MQSEPAKQALEFGRGQPAKRAEEESPWRKPWVSVAGARVAREAGERSRFAAAIFRLPKVLSLGLNALDAAPPRCPRTPNALGLTLSPASRASSFLPLAPHGLRHGLSSFARFAGSRPPPFRRSGTHQRRPWAGHESTPSLAGTRWFPSGAKG
jgi:hypothetical protein